MHGRRVRASGVRPEALERSTPRKRPDEWVHAPDWGFSSHESRIHLGRERLIGVSSDGPHAELTVTGVVVPYFPETAVSRVNLRFRLSRRNLHLHPMVVGLVTWLSAR